MRKFNDREKNIIRQLCKIESHDIYYFQYYIGKLFYKKESNCILYFEGENKKIYLLIRKVAYNKELQNKEINKLLELVLLLRFLIINRYIEIISELEIDKKDNFFIEEPINFNIEEYENIDLGKLDLYDLIKETFFGLLYITEELKHLAENNFKTDEKKRFKKNYRLTWAGIIVAFLVGIFGLFNPFTSTVRIEESQYKQAIQQLDELKDQLKIYDAKLDSLNAQINNNARTQKSPL